MYCDPNSYGDYLPVDYAVNGLMVCSWNYLYLKYVSDFTPPIFCQNSERLYICYHFACIFFVTRRDESRRVYHLVSSAEVKVSWKELIDCGRWIICNKLPLNGVVWYPGGSMKSNRLYHNICCILFHWIPAILIDCLLFCLRYPPV